jgi:hypothetical protein
MKRYRIEAQDVGSTTWKEVYFADSLPVAQRYAARLLESATIQAARVVDQESEEAWIIERYEGQDD